MYLLSSRNYHTLVQTKIADCFQHAIEDGHLAKVIWNQCLEKPTKVTNGKAVYSPQTQVVWKQLIQCIVSLPERISNQLELKTRYPRI